MKDKDMDVFKMIYKKYGPIVMNRCRRILANPEDQMDAFQDVFQKIAFRVEEFQQIENPIGWVYRVTTNTCLNVLRKQKSKGLSVSGEGIDGLIDPREAEKALESKDLVNEIFKRLSAREKEVFLYVYYDGMSQEEACKVMSVSRATLNRDISNIKELFHAQKAC